MPTPSILLIPDRYKAAVLYSQIPDSGAVDFDVTRATTAYRTNASGVLESVASGVPRLDYPIGGGCPSLLVEPAATNLALRSQELSVSGTWIPQGLNSAVAPVVTANAGVAPNGTTTAERIEFDCVDASVIANRSRMLQGSITLVSGTTYTGSVWIKAFDSGNVGKTLRIGTGSVTAATFTLTADWQRVTYTGTALSTSGDFIIETRGTLTTQTADALIWGAQLETGSVATSYIPTVAATATRNADVISKTGVSGFIGQTEGTLYIDLDYNQPPNDSGGRLLNVYETNDTTNSILSFISNVNQFQLTTFSGGASAVVISASAATIVPFGQNKFAIAYNGVNYTVYRNGLLFGSGTGLAPASLTAILLGSSLFNPRSINNRIRAAAIYTTRLDNAQLAALTTL